MKNERRQLLNTADADLFAPVAPAPKADASKQAERERQTARLAGRINLDLPPYLKERLLALSAKEGVPASQLVAFAIIRLIDDLSRGLPLPKAPSSSPRHPYVLELWENDAHKK